jgi:KAP family P-loop domain
MNWFSKIFSRADTPATADEPRQALIEPAATTNATHTASAADNPIRKLTDDRIGRARAAEHFATSVLRLDASEGLVVGVLGPWGSGKTSFVNLARPIFESGSVPVLDFNPWMFSGAEQLVQSFFSELSAQLKLKPGLAEVGKGLEEYGDIFSNLTWLPVIGPWIERGQDLAKLVGGVLQRKKEGVAGQRAKVDKALRELQRPIVVVLDDIDRLNTSEIRDIFRLVRLTANFPNVIYVLAFDRKRVEDALSEHGIPGRAYLEKILQIGFDLPAIPEHVLSQQISDSLNAELEGLPNAGNFDQTLWPDVFMEVVRPLITNMRDVRRYATAVGGTVRALDGQIALVDILGLEAVRVFLPDVFLRMPTAVAALTTPSDGSHRVRDGQDPLKIEIQTLIESAGSRASVATAMIERLFMAAQRHISGMNYGGECSRRWLRERRVAHADILRLYLERVAGEGLLAFNQAEIAWALMTDADAFSAHLRGLDRDQIVETIASLEAYEDEITPERVLPGAITLLNILPTLPEKDRGMFGLGTQMAVGRVVYRLIRSQNSETFVEGVVRDALPLLETAFAKLTLVQMVGHREEIGHKLVPDDVAEEFEKIWRSEFRGLGVDELANESELLQSFLIANREAEDGEPVAVVPADARITRALLQSARSESRSQSMGSRAVTKSARLAWKVLVDIYGTEVALQQRVDELRAADFEDCSEVLQLADRYLSGWRPKDFGE